MNIRLRWFVPPAAFVVLGMMTMVSPAHATTLQSLERTLKVNGPVDLRVKAGSEDLSVRRGDDGSVFIKCIVRSQNEDGDSDETGNLPRLAESDLRIHQDGNQVSIDPIEDRNKIRRLNVLYEITVPANTRLSYEAGSGDLMVDGIRGPVEYKSGSGDVHIRSTQENIRVHTGSGDVSLEDVGNGQIEVETHSGDVQVSMGSGAGYDLTAHTGSGDISVGPEISVEAGDMKNEIRGKVRGGGRPVAIRTGSGDVRIE